MHGKTVQLTIENVRTELNSRFEQISESAIEKNFEEQAFAAFKSFPGKSVPEFLYP